MYNSEITFLLLYECAWSFLCWIYCTTNSLRRSSDFFQKWSPEVCMSMAWFNHYFVSTSNQALKWKSTSLILRLTGMLAKNTLLTVFLYYNGAIYWIAKNTRSDHCHHVKASCQQPYTNGIIWIGGADTCSRNIPNLSYHNKQLNLFLRAFKNYFITHVKPTRCLIIDKSSVSKSRVFSTSVLECMTWEVTLIFFCLLCWRSSI